MPVRTRREGLARTGPRLEDMSETAPSAPGGDPSVLARRYDRRPRRTLGRGRRNAAIVVALTLATLFVVWIVAGQSDRPTTKDVGFDLISSAQVSVDFEVTRDPAQPVRCGIEALNDNWAVVGYTEVTLEAAAPEAERTTIHRAPVRTTNQANTGQVSECWPLD